MTKDAVLLSLNFKGTNIPFEIVVLIEKILK